MGDIIPFPRIQSASEKLHTELQAACAEYDRLVPEEPGPALSWGQFRELNWEQTAKAGGLSNIHPPQGILYVGALSDSPNALPEL
jgi:hypothetical protein